MTEARHRVVPVFVPAEGCPGRCLFCEQGRITGAASSANRSPAEMIAEALERCAPGGDGPPELAFYGGSFTCLPDERLALFLAETRRLLDLGLISSIRCSTRPDAIDRRTLDLLAGGGVSCVELGIQSADDRVLAACGRGHTFADAERAAGLLHQNGFAFGAQLMTGLPGTTPEIDCASHRRVADLAPGLVRIYPCLVIAGTPLERLWRSGAYRPAGLDETVEITADGLVVFEIERSIPVVRIGLLPPPDSDSILAGPFHPGLRELAEARVLAGLLTAALHRTRMSPGRVKISVMPGRRGLFFGYGSALKQNIEQSAAGYVIDPVESTAIDAWYRFSMDQGGG